MNEQLTRQAIFSAAKHARIPESVQALAEESVVKSREAYTKMSAVAKDGVKALEEVMVVAHAGTKAIGEKFFDHALTNAETAFDVAQAMARTKTIPRRSEFRPNSSDQPAHLRPRTSQGAPRALDQGRLPDLDSLNTAVTRSIEELRKADSLPLTY